LTGGFVKRGKGMIRILYDKEGDLLEIRFSEEQVAYSEYVEEPGIVIDYSKEGSIIALEFPSFSRKFSGGKVPEVLLL
jgi:uncharacterized protein YuzE